MNDHTFIPADGIRPEDALEGPIVRRLCICQFHCSLCLGEHEIELYISLPVADLDEYSARLRQYASNWDTLMPAFANAAMQVHTSRGDVQKLVRKARQTGLPRTRPPKIEITGESNYTCDYCSCTFDTIGKLRVHMDTCRSSN